MRSQRLDIPFLRSAFPGALPQFLVRQRWFGGKARTIVSTEALDIVTVPGEPAGFVALVRVGYEGGAAETYALPFMLASEDSASGEGQGKQPKLELAAGGGTERVVLLDALWEKEFCLRLLHAISGGKTLPGERSRIAARSSSALSEIWNPEHDVLDPAVLRGEQSNTSISYSGRLILKFFRKIEPGVNPDLEIGAFLTEKTSFTHIPRVAGWLEYQPLEGGSASLGILQEFVPNQGDAWKYTLAGLPAYFDRASAGNSSHAQGLFPAGPLLEAGGASPSEIRHWIGDYLEDAGLLARRTAELHQALASDASDAAFSPEPISELDRAALVRGMTDLMERVFNLLRGRMGTLGDGVRPAAQNLLAGEGAIRKKFKALKGENLEFLRTRIHGDYHLGQVLRAANDFVIIDFEGEPARPIAERRAKRSPLQDVAGMIRSFHYAAAAGLAQYAGAKASAGLKNGSLLSNLWYRWVASVYLREYFKATAGAVFLPREPRKARLLLESFLLEKAVYELGYELNNRPDWVELPLQGIRELMEER